ncbi:MAG: N-acetylmuramoyl-L-alanine amidase [Cytophagaceae bacterium]|nr:N-acetylmuramoyl-L-alanine amidase [Cytophagaceae bacterium]
MKRIILSISFIVLLVFTSFSPLGIRDYKVRTIVIDPGHGGKDPGCSGHHHQEAKITLQVAKELGRILQENLPGVKVIYTRTTDVFVELHERAAIANRHHADIFLSIHCNSGVPDVYGTETYTMGLHKSTGNLEVAKRENAVILKEDNHKQHYEGYDPNSPQAHILFSLYQNAYIENSLSLASKIETQFKNRVGRTSRGVKQAGLLVLWKTSMPSVLVELGFLTNKKEEQYMALPSNQVLLASGIYRAIKEYKIEIEQ